MEGQITLWQWQAMKDDIRKKLNETAENFVYMGLSSKVCKFFFTPLSAA